MFRERLPYPVLAALLALAGAVILNILFLWIIFPVFGTSGCPFWMVPINFSKTLDPADFHIVCLDAHGRIYPLQVGWLLNSLICFLPTLILFLVIFFLLLRWRKGRNSGLSEQA